MCVSSYSTVVQFVLNTNARTTDPSLSRKFDMRLESGRREEALVWALEAMSDGTIVSGDSYGRVQVSSRCSIGSMVFLFQQCSRAVAPIHSISYWYLDLQYIDGDPDICTTVNRAMYLGRLKYRQSVKHFVSLTVRRSTTVVLQN